MMMMMIKFKIKMKVKMKMKTYMKVMMMMMVHSGFGLSDWPIWTDFVGENFLRRALFFW